MALKPLASYSLASEASIELSQNNVHSLIAQIEAELYCSDTYRYALASLQTILGEAARTAQVLIQAVSREAIQLAMGQMSAHYQTVGSSQEQAIADASPFGKVETPVQSFGAGEMSYPPAAMSENPYSSRGNGKSAQSLGDRPSSPHSPSSDPSGQPNPTKKSKKFAKKANVPAPNKE